MSNKVKIIFTISLIANIFLLGLVGGYAFRSYNQMAGFHSARKSIAPESRLIMKDAFKDKRKDMRATIKEVRLKKKSLANIFAAKDFDAAAYDKEMKSLLGLGVKVSKYRLETFKDLAVKLPYEERKKLSRLLLAGSFRNIDRQRIINHGVNSTNSLFISQ